MVDYTFPYESSSKEEETQTESGWIPLPTTTEEGKPILWVRSDEPASNPGGVQLVDPRTGARAGSYSRSQFSDAHIPGKPEYRGEIRWAPTTAEVAYSLAKREAAKERVEQGYKSPSETWGEYIERKGGEPIKPSETYGGYIERTGAEVAIPSTFVAKQLGIPVVPEVEVGGRVYPILGESFIPVLEQKQVKIEETQRPTTSQEFATSLFEKQGKPVEVSSQGVITTFEEGKKVTIMPSKLVTTKTGVIGVKTGEIKKTEYVKPTTSQEFAQSLFMKQAKQIPTEKPFSKLSEWEKGVVIKTEPLYIFGKLPEKGAKITRWSELTKEEKVGAIQLPFKETSIPFKFTPPKEKSFLEKTQLKLDIKFEELQKEYDISGKFLEQQRREGKPERLAQYGIGLGYVGFRAFKGYTTPFIHPVETAKGLYQTVTHPIQTGKEMIIGWKKDPVGYTFEFFGNIAAFKVVGKGLSKLPKPALRTLDIPTTVGEPTRITLLGLETTKGRALTLGAKTPKGIKLGTPDISAYFKKIPEGKTFEGIKVGSALETKALQKALTKPVDVLTFTERAKELIPTIQKMERGTLNLKSKYLRELPKTTERLGETGTKVVYDIGREYGGKLFGSTSRETQLAKTYLKEGNIYELIKKPRDIELMFEKTSPELLQEITTKTVTRLKEKGISAREIKDMPYAIETKVKGGWEKAVEYKGKESIIEGEVVPEFVAGIRKAGKSIKIERLDVTTLPEELRGVSQGVLRIRREGKIIDIFPSPKRVKDIGSVSVSARTLLESKITGKPKLKANIEKFESFFPKELVEEQIRLIAEGKTKILFADFGKPTFKAPSPLLQFPIKQVSPSISKLPSSKSISPSLSRSISPSISKSISPSLSRSISPSISKSISPSLSRSISPSISKSISPSLSRSISPSISKSISPSRSLYRSISPSISKSISPSRSLYYLWSPPPPPTIPFGFFEGKEFEKTPKKKKGKEFDISPTYKPSLVGIERYKRFGTTVSKAPEFVSLGERPVTKEMIKGMKKFGYGF